MDPVLLSVTCSTADDAAERDLEADLRGREGVWNERVQRGREECLHELRGLWQKKRLHGGCEHEWAASEVV